MERHSRGGTALVPRFGYSDVRNRQFTPRCTPARGCNALRRLSTYLQVGKLQSCKDGFLMQKLVGTVPPWLEPGAPSPIPSGIRRVVSVAGYRNSFVGDNRSMVRALKRSPAARVHAARLVQDEPQTEFSGRQLRLLGLLLMLG